MDSTDQNIRAQTPGESDLTVALRRLTPCSHMLNTLQLIIDAHSLVSLTDRAGRITYVNDIFCKVSKFTREELIGQTHRTIKSEHHPPAFFEEMWSAIASGEVWNGDVRNKAKDGSLYWVQSTISPVFDEKNRIVGYGSIRTDVTAQRQLMVELQDNEQRAHANLKSAIDVLENGLTIFDKDGKVVISNRKRLEMYPEARDELKAGRSVSEILTRIFPDNTPEEIERRAHLYMTSETLSHRELSDGRHVRITRTKTPEGGMISLHSDVTDLVQQKKLLEEQAATMDLMMAIAVDANESPDAESAYASCIERICKYTGWEVGHVYLPCNDDAGRCRPADIWHCADTGDYSLFREKTERTTFDLGSGLPGRVFQSGDAAWVNDVTADAIFPRAEAARASGIKGGAAFPVKIRNKVIAVLEFYASQPIEPNPQLEEILSHVCTQMSQVAERDRSEKVLMSRVAAELRKRDRALVEQNECLDAALKNMTQGLCMFDSEQRLIVSNDRYAQMYDLPPQLLKPGITLRQIVEHRIANGIYAGANPEEYIKERMDWVSSGVYSYKTQILSDGRSMSITYQPMDGGGWVTTHEDITERMESEKALRESQELLSKAFRASPASMTISDPDDGPHIDVNETWTTMLGFSREEAMKSSAFELGIWVAPEMRSRFVEQINTNGSVTGFETTFRTKDGRHLDVLVAGENVEIGGEQRLLIVTHDITERKGAEAALRESENRFKNLVESTNVVPWEFDPGTMRFTYVGPQVVPLFGYPIEDWYEEGFWENSIHPDDREKTIRICAEATQMCLDHDFEYRVLTANGGAVWVRDVVSVVAVDGKAQGLRGVIIDISDRKKASEALERSEQRFKDIVEVSSDWIWECDENLRFTYLSARFTQITGIPEEQVLGKTRHEFGKDSVADWDAHLADLEARRSFRAFPYAVKNEDGDTQHWVISGRPVFDANGTFKGYRGTGAERTAEVRDQAELIRHRDHLQDLVDEATAELKQRANELRLALAKEKELNELQRQFVSMASHEFRTPLAIIDGAAQRLQRRAGKLTPEDTVKRVEKIRNAVIRMTQLMESTLDAARIEEGKINIKIADCDLRYIVLEAAMHQIELSPNHNITSDLKDLPDMIRGDEGAINQIFSNLVSNAVKYSPDACDIHVRGRRDGEFAVVDVRDHGLGIDEKDLPNMFQRFFRAKTSAGIAGTGIGLNLVKTLVELHSGSVKVESKKGEGSLFSIRLPIEGPQAANEPEGQAA